MLATLIAVCLSHGIRAQEAVLNQPAGIEPRAAAVERAEEVKPQATTSHQPLPLAPRGDSSARELARPRTPGSSQAITTVLGSLGAVLGLFFVAAWFWRRHMPKSMSQLPNEVVEQLGRASLTGKQQMHLVRVGQKLVLLAVTPVGVETLTEITDAEEVDRLCGLCRKNSPHGPSAEFRAVLRHFEREPARGFLGSDSRPRGGLHAEA